MYIGVGQGTVWQEREAITREYGGDGKSQDPLWHCVLGRRPWGLLDVGGQVKWVVVTSFEDL